MKVKTFKCAVCGVEGRSTSRDKLRNEMGWVVARDNETCYCPVCGIKYRSPGRNGAPKKITKQAV